MADLKHTEYMKGLKDILPEHLPAAYHNYRLGETRWFFQIYYGNERRIHYEVSRPSAQLGRMLEIGLHFETRNKDLNQRLVAAFARHMLEIHAALGEQIVAERWDRGWAKVYEAYPSEALTNEAQLFAAQRLGLFVATVQPVYQHIRQEI